MGAFCASKGNKLNHIMLAGIESSGKTFFLYSKLNPLIKNDNKVRTKSTESFNYEEFLMGPYNIAVWDLPGKENLRMLWPNFYRNIKFSGVVYMINYEDKDTLSEAVRVMHDLLSEEELAGTSLIIVANCTKKQQQEKNIDDDMDIKPGELQNDNYIQQLTDQIKKNIYFDLINQEKKDIFICDIYDEKATQKDTDRISIYFKNYLSDLSK